MLPLRNKPFSALPTHLVKVRCLQPLTGPKTGKVCMRVRDASAAVSEEEKDLWKCYTGEVLSVLMTVSPSHSWTVRTVCQGWCMCSWIWVSHMMAGWDVQTHCLTLHFSIYFGVFFRQMLWISYKNIRGRQKFLLVVLSVMWNPHRLIHTATETDMTQQRSWSNLKWFSAAICPLLGMQHQPHILLASQKSVKCWALMLSLSHKETGVL